MFRLIPFLALAACTDETLTGYGAADAVWQLSELNGVVFSAEATIAFPEPGRVTGNGPCNAFTAAQTVPYPWISIDDIAATRRACPDLAQEAAYFAALEAVTLAEVAGDVMILSSTDGPTMVFSRR